MVGRLGSPNAGRLTTSALLKTNKVFAAAADGFFRIPYKSALMSDRVAVGNVLGSPKWTASTSVTETVAIAEPYLEMLVTVIEELTDAMSLADAFGSSAIGYEFIEGLGIDDAMVVGSKISVSDGVKIVDLIRRGVAAQASETIGASDTVRIVIGTIVRERWQALDTTISTTKYRPVALDRVTVQDALQRGVGASATDALGLAEQALASSGVIILDSAQLQDGQATKLKYALIVVEQSGVRESLVVGFPVSVSDSVAIAELLRQLRSISVLERVLLPDTLATRVTYKQTMQDAARLTDALRRFFGGDVVDGVAVSDLSAYLRRAPRSVSDTVGVNDTTSRKFILRVTAPEGLRVTDTQALRMVFNRQVSDGVEIAAAYISPGNSVTTWAINTKNAAVTEYSNYEFNSFAKVGHKYISASASGLYELDGNTDAGTNIIAQIKSGFAQFGGSRFTSFKAAYLGMRGSGDFVLKLETGDGKTYNYAVVGKDMETTKVHLGKGLRARYFAFELISTGQDFDLDDIEFMPLVAQRRV